MKNYQEQELLAIVNGFIEKTLDKSLWTHEAHISTAIWFLKNYKATDALCRLRSGIINYNISTGGENTGQNGYHETITIFWWEVLKQFIANKPQESFAATCTLFLDSVMAEKTYPFNFYTRETLLSALARAIYIQPDLKEIQIDL